MDQLIEVTLASVQNGAAPELWQHEWKRVLQNIQDPNTDPEQKRSVTITVSVEPSEDREGGVVTLEVSSKIAGPKPLKSAVHFADKHGQPVAVSFDPKQRQLFGDDEGIRPINHERAQSGGRP